MIKLSNRNTGTAIQRQINGNRGGCCLVSHPHPSIGINPAFFASLSRRSSKRYHKVAVFCL